MNKKRLISLAALAVGVTIATTAAGCDKYNEPYRDAPRTNTSNVAPAQVITMPDGFNNLASKCDGPNRVYVVYHGDHTYGSVAVVPNDPRCTGTSTAR